jgi:hypothetical protein
MPKNKTEQPAPTLNQISRSLSKPQKEAIAEKHEVHLNTVYNVLKGRTIRLDILKTCLLVYNKNKRVLDKVNLTQVI